MRKILLLAALAAAAATPLSQAAAQTSPPALAPVTAAFVAPESLNLSRLLPPWPADDTLAGQTDLDVVLAIQAYRTPADEEEARVDSERGAMAWAQAQLGPVFNAEDYPKSAALLEAARQNAVAVIREAKVAHPRRDRPTERDDRVWRATRPGHADSSYPSARAIGAQIWGEVLADIFPERAEGLRNAAARSAWLRVVAGTHYPSDLVGSRIVADALIKRMRASPEYQRMLREARAEAERLRSG